MFSSFKHFLGISDKGSTPDIAAALAMRDAHNCKLEEVWVSIDVDPALANNDRNLGVCLDDPHRVPSLKVETHCLECDVEKTELPVEFNACVLGYEEQVTPTEIVDDVGCLILAAHSVTDSVQEKEIELLVQCDADLVIDKSSLAPSPLSERQIDKTFGAKRKYVRKATPKDIVNVVLPMEMVKPKTSVPTQRKLCTRNRRKNLDIFTDWNLPSSGDFLNIFEEADHS